MLSEALNEKGGGGESGQKEKKNSQILSAVTGWQKWYWSGAKSGKDRRSHTAVSGPKSTMC